jgi:hypothetical protein
MRFEDLQIADSELDDFQIILNLLFAIVQFAMRLRGYARAT